VNILVTGGMGFIGSNFIDYHLIHYPDDLIVNLDVLTYAANDKEITAGNYRFYQGNINDQNLVQEIVNENSIELIVNFAAETHVDRSIINPKLFVETNVLGVTSLLEVACQNKIRIIQISTDEVYGSLSKGIYADESSILKPSSPYSATKASADLLVLSYSKTYDLDVNIIRSTNNYGPYQHSEKLIPKIITSFLELKKIPIYGDGKNVRNWLYVEDNVRAIEIVIHEGRTGEIYNVGTNDELNNLEIVSLIQNNLNETKNLVEYVPDRLGHDERYGIDSTKIKTLGWQPRETFNSGIKRTVEWYRGNHKSVRDR
jgi:dTDP-glucose 4,6-dehydratase